MKQRVLQRPGSRRSSPCGVKLLVIGVIGLAFVTLATTGLQSATARAAHPLTGLLLHTPTVTEPVPTDTPVPTATLVPTDTPTHTPLPTDTPTHTPLPTDTPLRLPPTRGSSTDDRDIATPNLEPWGTPSAGQPANFTPTEPPPGGRARRSSTLATPTPPPLITPVSTIPLVARGPCMDQFVPFDLDHTILTNPARVGRFETIGAGVAVNDLDNDGDLDIVLGAHDGPDSLLWNEGDLRFRQEPLGTGETRAVAIVDSNGDGWQDIVLTDHAGEITLWRNRGASAPSDIVGSAAQFMPEAFAALMRPAFAVDWSDVDGDGDLDMVTAANPLVQSATDALANAGGVVLYRAAPSGYVPTIVGPVSNALAVTFFDASRDNLPDIIVGNAGALVDQLWVQAGTGWADVRLFAVTSYDSRGFVRGDIDNNGSFDLLGLGASPYSTTLQVRAAWQPFAPFITPAVAGGGTEVSGNVLQMRGVLSGYNNRAPELGIAATGWSWSGALGDVDNDGFVDLYVVNGLHDVDLLGHLPNQELVEGNQAFRNNAGLGFLPAPAWQVASTRGGRGMVMADLDTDGDLDIVINNLERPALLYENRLCRGHSLEVDLLWSTSLNHRGVGAQLALTVGNQQYVRAVHVGSGYLSSNPSRIHFGLPTDAPPTLLEVRWPDGAITQVNELGVDQLIVVAR